jgi:hypothetical protein
MSMRNSETKMSILPIERRRMCLKNRQTKRPEGPEFLYFQTRPNDALQRTGSAVTLAASGLRLSPTVLPARQSPPLLSLRSLGGRARASQISPAKHLTGINTK